MPTTFRRAKAIAIGAGILTAVLSSFSNAQAQDAHVVNIKNFMFAPMALTIKAGSTVTWKNLDGEPHIVVSEAGTFRSNALDQDDTFQYKFDKPGVYKIFCGIHPNMKETITVQ
jgi:plastocyanin